MPQETQEPAESQDPGPTANTPGDDIAADDPGPIEIDFLMKGASPTFGDLLADWDEYRRYSERDQDDAER